MFVVRSGNLGLSADEYIECNSAFEVGEVLRDAISDYRSEGFRLETCARTRRFKHLNPGESVRAALLISPVAAIAIQVERV